MTFDTKEETILFVTAYIAYCDACNTDGVERRSKCRADFYDDEYQDREKVSQYLCDSDMELWDKYHQD